MGVTPRRTHDSLSVKITLIQSDDIFPSVMKGCDEDGKDKISFVMLHTPKTDCNVFPDSFLRERRLAMQFLSSPLGEGRLVTQLLGDGRLVM